MSIDEPAICPTCRKPLETASGGFITQFLGICRCGEAAPDQAESIKICSLCRKPVGSRKQGSLTQFVFSAGQCSCGEQGLGVVANHKQAMFCFLKSAEHGNPIAKKVVRMKQNNHAN